MPHRRASADQGDPPEYLLSLPTWLAQGRSADPSRAMADWDRARQEWVRSAPTLDAANLIYGPGFNPGPEPDPRARGNRHTRGETQ